MEKCDVRYENYSLAKNLALSFVIEFENICAWNYREHTILLSKERLNKGTKRMNSFTFVSSCHLLTYAAYKSCVTL